MKATIHCYRCGATYAAAGKWVVGYFEGPRESTAGDRCFHKLADVEMDHCPFCRKPPQLDPTPEVRPM